METIRPLLFPTLEGATINANFIEWMEEREAGNCHVFVLATMSSGRQFSIDMTMKDFLQEIERRKSNEAHEFFDKLQTAIESANHNSKYP
jgi:S-adenosylmethionine:diacylglycerol 3-amino-3-carboxypropyl transferase